MKKYIKVYELSARSKNYFEHQSDFHIYMHIIDYPQLLNMKNYLDDLIEIRKKEENHNE